MLTSTLDLIPEAKPSAQRVAINCIPLIVPLHGQVAQQGLCMSFISAYIYTLTYSFRYKQRGSVYYVYVYAYVCRGVCMYDIYIYKCICKEEQTTNK